MSEKYRIEITRINEDGDETTELLIEGSKAIVRASLSFAPAALGDEPAGVVPSAPVNATSSYAPGEQEAKPPRTRRTKAEMEAARAAEATPASPAPVTAPAGVTTEAPLSTPIAYAPPAVEPAPAAPYNPFAPAS